MLVHARKLQFIHVRGLFTCVVECLMLVYARKLHFVHVQGPWVHPVDCTQYLYNRKHQFIHFHHLCARAEDCFMHIHVRKPKFVYYSSPCASIKGCILYVLALKCRFMHLQGPGECTVDLVRYLYPRKSILCFPIIRTHVQNAVKCIGNTNLCMSKGHAHAQETSQCMSTLLNTILCTNEVTVPLQKAV